MKKDIQNRYEFVLFFDVQDGNPNGDPDAGNTPRLDPSSGHGLVTDVCIKRKLRNFVSIVKEECASFKIYIKERAVLNDLNQTAYEDLNIEKSKNSQSTVDSARNWMCKEFFDVRAFGAVMSTGVNCGQVRGPVQITFARSLNPILSLDHSITRMAVTTQEESKKQAGGNRTMGRKSTVPYALYRVHGFISPHFARQTGFSEEDLELFWQALLNMFEHDRSAARGQMSVKKLIIFKHASALGNARADQLFNLVQVSHKNPRLPAGSFDEYEITYPRSDSEAIPPGVSIEVKL